MGSLPDSNMLEEPTLVATRSETVQHVAGRATMLGCAMSVLLAPLGGTADRDAGNTSTGLEASRNFAAMETPWLSIPLEAGIGVHQAGRRVPCIARTIQISKHAPMKPAMR
jgi:hypothetical protein